MSPRHHPSSTHFNSTAPQSTSVSVALLRTWKEREFTCHSDAKMAPIRFAAFKMNRSLSDTRRVVCTHGPRLTGRGFKRATASSFQLVCTATKCRMQLLLFGGKAHDRKATADRHASTNQSMATTVTVVSRLHAISVTYCIHNNNDAKY